MPRSLFCSIVLGAAAWLGPALCAQEEAINVQPHLADLAAQLDRDCSLEGTCKNTDRYGDAKVNYGPSRGYFPEGCRWREVFGTDKTTSVLEYWNAASQEWVGERPALCTLQTVEPGPEYHWNKEVTVDGAAPSVPSPVSRIEPASAHTLMKNLWYNNGRWYALVEGTNHIANIKMSRNQEITCLHVRNATEWMLNTRHVIVPGDTLIFDFIFFVHPTAIGHWCEMMFPLFSILERNPSFRRPATNFVLLHLKRWHLMEWVRSIVATTLGVQAGDDLPPIILQDATEEVYEQVASPLEGVPSDTWVSFENAMVVRDLFTGGKRSFADTQDARNFRDLIYRNHGLSPPGPQSGQPTVPPKTITFLRKRANRRVLNEDALLDLLGTYAPVNVVEFNATHSFQEQIATMSKTGVLVSVHTSALANSPFLPPGSAVVELIQRFWNWNKLDKSFYEQTQAMGDIHHFAWRAYHANQTVYLADGDVRKFADWTDAQCKIEECVEAHTNVDIIVDIPELKALLDSRLPLVFAGKAVSEATAVWPPNDPGETQPWESEPGYVEPAAEPSQPTAPEAPQKPKRMRLNDA